MPAIAPDVRAAPEGRDAQAFPRLSDDQIDRVAAFGTRETLSDGHVVFERGQRLADFFVLVSGCIEIYDFDCEGEPHVFTRHCDGQFTGEIDLFSDRKVLVGGRIAGDSEVLRLGRDQFREMLAAEPDVGDIVIRAFILRRIGILEGNLGGALLIGANPTPRRFASGRSCGETATRPEPPISVTMATRPPPA